MGDDIWEDSHTLSVSTWDKQRSTIKVLHKSRTGRFWLILALKQIINMDITTWDQHDVKNVSRKLPLAKQFGTKCFSSKNIRLKKDFLTSVCHTNLMPTVDINWILIIDITKLSFLLVVDDQLTSIVDIILMPVQLFLSIKDAGDKMSVLCLV